MLRGALCTVVACLWVCGFASADELDCRAAGFVAELAEGWKLRESRPGMLAWASGPGDSVQVFFLSPEKPPVGLSTLDELKAGVAALGEGLAEGGADVLGFRTFALADGGIAAFVEYRDAQGQLGGQAVLFHPELAYRLMVRGAPWPGVALQPALKQLLEGLRFVDAEAPHLPEERVEDLSWEVGFRDLGLALKLPESWQAEEVPGTELAARFRLPDGSTLEVWGSFAIEPLAEVLKTLDAEEDGVDWSHRETWESAGLQKAWVHLYSDERPSGDLFGIVDLGGVKAMLHFKLPAVEVPFRRQTLRGVLDSARALGPE